jgi:hypothetical protein
VLHLAVGEDKDTGAYRYLQTQPSLTHDAKDRSGKLDAIERPNMGDIFKKVLLTKEEK